MSIVSTNNQHYTDIADAIRGKNGLSTTYKPSEMAAAIDALNVSGVITLQDKSTTPTESTQYITYDSGYDGLDTVTVNPIPSSYIIPTGSISITSNNTYNVSQYASAVVNVSGSTINNQNKSVTPTESQQSVTYDSGYTGLGTVTVGAISSTYVGSDIARNDTSDIEVGSNMSYFVFPSGYWDDDQGGSISSPQATKGSVSNHSVSVTPSVAVIIGNTEGTINGTAVTVSASELVSGSKSITSNATGIDVTNYASVDVAVPTGGTINNQDKTVNPSTSQQQVTADTGYTGLGTVTVTAMPTMTLPASTSSTSSGTSKASINPSTSAQYLNIPTGYNSTAQYYTINAMSTMTLPTSASSSATSGYTSKATIGRSTSDQYINIPTGYNSAGAYYKVSAVANGSATGPSSLTASSATVSTGTNTITLTKTGVSTTPTVSAGYVSSATSSTATVALTASVTTKGATTYTPTTTNQTIASGTYLTGTQTISGDANLVGSNIISGKSIFGVAGTVTFQTYYTGSSAPSSSLGSNGDIYLQS